LFLTGLLGRFGQGLMVTYSSPVYWVAGVVGLVAVAGWIKTARPAAGVAAERQPTSTLLALHWFMVLIVVGALLFYAVTVAPGLPGRYLFPAFPSLAVVVAGGWLAWFPHRSRPVGTMLLGGLMLAATLYGLFGLLVPTYRMPPTPSARALQAMIPLDANIGETALVLGYTLNCPSVRPGETLVVTLYWQPVSRTDVPYTVFVQLYDPAVGLVAQRDSYPGLGNYATTVWDVGRAFVDTYRLDIPAGASPTTAQLVVGLYDGATGVRLPVTGADAGPPELAWAVAGPVSITP
jgi:hypothetical protein